MRHDSEKYDALLSDFDLLGRIVSAAKAPALAADPSRVDAIVNDEIPEALKKNAPPDYYEIYMDFKAEYELFHDFILFDKLIGKCVVALGGGFSSGKSSFLNALDGERALPVDLDPSTAVPTFIVRGETHSAFGINIFDARVEIGLHEIHKIGHGFGEAESADGRGRAGSATLGHVLERIFLASPKQRYENLAFLDTPGYSKPDSGRYSAKTDEEIARKQLNSANYILWFVQADAGTIPEDDIKFIKGLRADIPKLIVLNKADKKPEKDLEEIVSKIRETLAMQGVPCEDVLRFSCENPDGYDAEKIRGKLSAWNAGGYRPHFARNFETLFSRCREYYEKEIEDERRRLNRLNTSILKLDSDDADVREQLELLVKEIARNLGELNAIREKLVELKNGFFSEMKRIGDQVGIPMPEPSEIDMIDDAPDAMRVVLAYKKAKGIRSDAGAAELLRRAFSDIKPAMALLPGGGGYAHIADTRSERHPFEGHPLAGEEDYRKNLYLRALCMALRYENEVSEEQTSFLRRLVAGAKAELLAADYMRQSFDVTVEAYGEFAGQIGRDGLKYAFAVDLMCVCHIKPCADEQTAFVAEIIESLRITREELDCLSRLARGILGDVPSPFFDSKIVWSKEIRRDLFACYFTGATITEDAVICERNGMRVFLALTPNASLPGYLLKVAGADTVLFEGFSVQASDSDESVVFIDLQGSERRFFFSRCVFDGLKNPLNFADCAEVGFDRCVFKDFTTKTLRLENVGNAVIEQCEFKGCVEYWSLARYDWQARGCVIDAPNLPVRIEDSGFIDCGGKTYTIFFASAIISNAKAAVRNCTFENCWNYHNNTQINPEDPRRCLFSNLTADENNTVINSARLGDVQK
jgi:hypothetical protein